MTEEMLNNMTKIMPVKGSDVLDLIERAITQLRNEKNTNPQHSLLFYNSVTHLASKLSVELFGKPLPDLTAGWYYSFEVSNTSASVYIKHAVDYQMQEDRSIPSISYDCRYRLVHYPVQTYSVEEFAQQNKVESVTVRQWIRRGKLRTAIKNGGEWRIPATAEVPTRGAGAVTYYTNGAFVAFPSEFHHMGIDSSVVNIRPVKRDTFEITVDGICLDTVHPRYFTDDERVKVEEALRATPGVINSECIVGIWPAVNETSMIVPVRRSGGMSLPVGWNSELF